MYYFKTYVAINADWKLMRKLKSKKKFKLYRCLQNKRYLNNKRNKFFSMSQYFNKF